GLHPWIYRSDVADVQAESGDVVRLLGPNDRFYGYALYSEQSQISLRRLTDRGDRPDEEFWRRRLQAAVEYRASLGIQGDAYRLVHAEADRLPALIVDRYGDYLVMQTLTRGIDRRRDLLAAALVELLEPKGILARNDPRVRELEGLTRSVELLHGDVPELVEVTEGTTRYRVDLWGGQKTGLFLDQRENRDAAARYARGRLLDCFSYSGGFALALAPRCETVTAVDVSEEAIGALGVNAELNGLEVHGVVANAFDQLRALDQADERFDTVCLDPPAFAKNKRAVDKALNGYKEINLRAMKLLDPGGHLITCSCSYHVDDDLFEEMLQEAAADVSATMTIVERRGQSRDHPVMLGVPETSYLKCFILRRQA
ncbi:MAG: class I SAM-dependent rRNA methyltransferase, partial [Acidobacteriota bacterium]